MSQGKITDKQREILEYIKEMILKKGYPPAVREICEAVHLKTAISVVIRQSRERSRSLMTISP